MAFFLCLLLAAAQDLDGRIREILQYREVGKKVKILKHQTEAAADFFQLLLIGVYGHALLIGFGGIVAGIKQIAAVHLREQRGAAQEGGLSAAGGADNGYHLTLGHSEADVLENMELGVVEALFYIFDFQYVHFSQPPY